MRKTKAILPILLAVFLCLSASASAVYAQENEGYAKFDRLCLDDVYYTVSVEPGETIQAEVFFGYVAPTSSRPEDKIEIVIVFDGTPIIGCLIEEIGQAEHLDGHDYVRTFEIIAPTEPGLYRIVYGYSEGCTCEQAKLLFNLAHTIGTIEVIEDRSEEWIRRYVNVTELYPNENLEEYYKIAFYQRGNEIRIEINSFGPNKIHYYQIYSGSVSISVSEDMYVYYDTGNVSCVLHGESTYGSIPYPSKAWEAKLALLIAGFIPGLGCSLSVVGVVGDIIDRKNIVNIYKKDDRTEGPRYPPGEFFNRSSNRSSVLNWRDIVVVPWYLEGWNFKGYHAASAIRINCPDMRFPYTGTHNMIYRIDCHIGEQKIRHDIALPIKFTSTGTTDDLPIKKTKKEI